MFHIFRKYGMKFNPRKCAFGVSSGKFLGYMFNSRGIEANPKKIQTIINMKASARPKEVQSLTGRIATLSRFVSKSTNLCKPFFDTLQGGNFFWVDLGMPGCFQQTKEIASSTSRTLKTKGRRCLEIILSHHWASHKCHPNSGGGRNTIPLLLYEQGTPLYRASWLPAGKTIICVSCGSSKTKALLLGALYIGPYQLTIKTNLAETRYIQKNGQMGNRPRIIWY